MRLTSASSVLWAPVASSVAFRAAIASADAAEQARGTYEYLRADPTSSSSSSSIQKDLPPKLSHRHEADQQDVNDAEKTTKNVVDLTDADADAEILSDDATTGTVDAGLLPRAAPPGRGAGGAHGTDDAHWSAVQPRKLKAAKEPKAPKQARKAPKQAKGAPGCAKGFCAQLGGSGFYGAGTCTTAPNNFVGGLSLFVSVTLDANDTGPDVSWVLKKRGSNNVIVNCSLDSDQCQSPSSFTGGSTLQTTVQVDPNECYTATMYACSGQGLYGSGSWSVALNGKPYFGSNAAFSADSVSVGNCP